MFLILNVGEFQYYVVIIVEYQIIDIQLSCDNYRLVPYEGIS